MSTTGSTVRHIRAAEIGAAMRRHWFLFAVLVTFGTVTTAIVTARMPRLYEAEVSIEVSGQRAPILGVQALPNGSAQTGGPMGPDVGIVLTSAQELRSRGLAATVIDDLRLADDPEFADLAQPSWVAQFRQKLGRMLRALAAPAGSDLSSEPERDWEPRARLVNAFLENLSVSTNDRTYLIKVRYRSWDPEKSARIANTIATEYFKRQMAAKLQMTNQTNAWLRDRVADAAEQLRQANDAVHQFRESHKLLAAEGDEVSANRLTELYVQLSMAKAEAATAAAQFQDAQRISPNLRASGELFRIDGSANASASAVLSSPLIQKLREQQAEVVRREAEIRSIYGSRHPSSIKIEGEANDLRKQIAAEIDRIVIGLAKNAQTSRARVAILETDIADLRSRITEVNRDEGLLREFEKAADVSRTSYEELLAKYRDTENADDFPLRDARIVDLAEPPSDPAYPKLGLFVATGFLGSSSLGLALALLLDFRRRGFISSIEVEDMLGVRVAGMIPTVRKVPDPSGQVRAQPRSLYAEAVRSIWPTMEMAGTTPSKVVMITSSVPGEGKSTLAISLAHALVDAGRKVVVVDFDLRRPGLSKRLRLSDRAGLVTVLEHDTPVEDCVMRERGGAIILPAGGSEDNPQRLLCSPRMRQMIAELKRYYDVVLLDAPPALAVSDPMIASRLVDSILYVVQWRRTPRSAVAAGIKQLRASGVQFASVVLTRVDLGSHASYGFGDVAHYYRRHRRYYAG